jgi:rare lipoprotein A
VRVVAGSLPSGRARSLRAVAGGRATPPGLAACLALLLLVGCAHTPRSEPAGEEGEASWYGPGLYGRKTASGEVLRPGTLTAAHRTLPFGTCLRVTNLENGRVVEVRVNDRGPYAAGRILDVSETAARALGMHGRGVTRVRLERCPGSAERDRPELEAGPGGAVARAWIEGTAEDL